jgi:replication factor A1
MKVTDYSGSQWMSAFDESGVVILGRTAGEMRNLRSSDPNLFDSIVDDCFFRPLVLKVQVKEQEYQGERKIRYLISRCENVDFVSESRALLSELAAYGVTA